MWTSGMFGWAGYGGTLNAVSESLGLIVLLVLVAAMLTWLTLPSDREDAGSHDNRATSKHEPLLRHGGD